MLKQAIRYLKNGNDFVGLEVCQVDDIVYYFVVLFQRKKDEIVFGDRFRLDDIAELEGLNLKGRPLFLVVNTKQVLSKVVTTPHKGSILHAAFPDINLNEFYYAEAVKGAVAVCRKTVVDKLIAELKELKLSAVDVFLGVTSLQVLIPFLLSKEVKISNSQVEIQEEHFLRIQKGNMLNQMEYQVNGIDLLSTDLLAFSGVLSNITAANEIESNLKEQVAVLKDFFEQQRIFGLSLKAAIGMLLLLLLGNFFYFDFYFGEVEKMQQDFDVSKLQKKHLKSAFQRVKNKKEKVEKLLSASSSKNALLLDKIAISIPGSIILNSLVFQPLLLNVKKGKEIEVEENEVSIEGISKDSELFSRWVAELEQFNGIATVAIKDYDYNTSSTSTFLIVLMLNDEL